MKSYVLLTFGFMGWAYYEMSGGSDFVPVETVTAAVVIQEDQAPEIVTRASSPTLLALSTSNIVSSDDVNEAVAANVDVTESDEAVVVLAAAPVVAPKLDIREVMGSRVNMRMGPGTDFEVITTLNPGTELEVLNVNADGWANVATVDRGIEGWMAARLLTEPKI
ncbi:SH3 domain-containing protein [Octadecabacter sp. 1_MG-2023]|uniref:SH3 domain-containing protein n=1 Tax=unclassified Octadecabacter TaxID=196158 RepID=UPI001C091A9E|nr:MULTISPECIES: SH3 domain-containing protein [unclassified Octadecabacter]MBU2992635.1 SH3 domain-containing protein [Octadecabacter sp. B2R22]MDO6734608.1 SH3 domain-containing protein [Octadecabacter sp. 1_MG-2023]